MDIVLQLLIGANGPEQSTTSRVLRYVHILKGCFASRIGHTVPLQYLKIQEAQSETDENIMEYKDLLREAATEVEIVRLKEQAILRLA